jgi:hypothetical protein
MVEIDYVVDFEVREEVVTAKTEPISDWAMRVGAELEAMRKTLAKWMPEGRETVR